jgi:hypothetical protein
VVFVESSSVVDKLLLYNEWEVREFERQAAREMSQGKQEGGLHFLLSLVSHPRSSKDQDSSWLWIRNNVLWRRKASLRKSSGRLVGCLSIVHVIDGYWERSRQ